MQKDNISIIVPTYNRVWCITRAIESVLNQNSGKWNLIIIDDGSTDDTVEKISTYLIDERIRYYKIKNSGVGAARNYGVQKATTEYVTFLDSDDEFLPNTITQMHRDVGLDPSGKFMLYLSFKNDNPEYKDIKADDYSTIDFKMAIEGKWPSVETVQLLPRKIFESIKFPELAGGMEIIFWHQVLKAGFVASVHNIVLRIYHTEHDSRLTGWQGIRDRAETMPALYDTFLEEFGEVYLKWNPNRLAYFYLEKGIFEIVAGDTVSGRKSLLKSVKYNKSKTPIVFGIAVLSYLPTGLFCRMVEFGHRYKKLIT